MITDKDGSEILAGEVIDGFILNQEWLTAATEQELQRVGLTRTTDEEQS